MAGIEPIEAEALLIVEGKTDKGFFRGLLREIGLTGIQVLDLEGAGNLAVFLETLDVTPGFHENVSSVGIVLDADAAEDDAFQAVCDALDNAGWSVPAAVETPTGDAPQVAVLILPGAGQPGMLEDLILESLASNPILACVDAFFACLPAPAVPPPNKRAKARVATVLSSGSRPGRPVHIASLPGYGYWSWTSPAFDGAKEFLRSL